MADPEAKELHSHQRLQQLQPISPGFESEQTVEDHSSSLPAAQMEETQVTQKNLLAALLCTIGLTLKLKNNEKSQLSDFFKTPKKKRKNRCQL